MRLVSYGRGWTNFHSRSHSLGFLPAPWDLKNKTFKGEKKNHRSYTILQCVTYVFDYWMFLFSSCGLPRLTNFHHSGHVLTFSTRPTGRYVKTKFLKNKKVATKSYSTHVYQISVSLDVRLGGYGPTIFIILVFFAPFFGLFSHITFNFNKF